MRKLALALAIAAALVLTACGSDSDDSSGSDSDSGSDSGEEATGDGGDGEVLFSDSCTSCHGPDAAGIDGLGKDLRGTTFIVDTPTDELVAMIKGGRSVSDPDNTTGVDMPPNGGNPALSDADIEAIVVYLKGL